MRKHISRRYQKGRKIIIIASVWLLFIMTAGEPTLTHITLNGQNNNKATDKGFV